MRAGTHFRRGAHVAGTTMPGDFQTGGITAENVVGTFWSFGAAVVFH